MSRRRKSKAKKERLLEPEEVLDGRVEVRVEDLFDLIHRVNPTRKWILRKGHRISRQEQTRRYALKNRLQSLLIRRFGDDHLKVETTEQPGIVSLGHVSGLRDACHAIAAELEPDARSWVRRQLDLAAGDAGEPELSIPVFEDSEVETGAAAEVDDLLERGRQALEEYDYEAGEELLRRAFEAGHRGAAGELQRAAAAQALLEMQVDLLGMDEAALALEARLSAATRQRPGIRTLLALAAARQGDADHALELVSGLTASAAGVSLPRAAEVYVALASNAIGDRDRKAARQHLDRVTELDPTHARIPALETEVEKLRAEDLSGIEADLERRFREQGAAAVEGEARALADRWPAGEVARRILRRAAAERHAAEIAEHLEHGEQARAEGRYDDAARHFQAALDAGCEQADLPALAAEMADLDRQQREHSAVDDVLQRFNAAGGARRDDARREAFLAYLSLAGDLRARARDGAGGADGRVLDWLDEIEAPRSGARAQAAATAALALERAGAALEGGRPEDAIGLVEPHRVILGRVARARDLGREARRQIAEQCRQRALESLAAAEDALGEGRRDDARRHLAITSRGDLEPDDLARVQDLQAGIDGLSVLERLEHEHDERLAAGDLTGALARARRLAEAAHATPAPGDQAARWSRNVEEIQDRIRVAWGLEVVEDADLPAEAALRPAQWHEKSVTWLDDDGRELVLANAWNHWLFIDAVDLDAGRITDRVSLWTPEALEPALLTLRDGDRLWIADRAGNVLELARDGWKVLGFYPVQELLSGDRRAERARPMPGGRLWLQVTEWGLDEIFLLDLRRWRLGRKLPPEGGRWVPIPGDDPRMLVSGSGFAARVYTAQGELASEPLTEQSVLDADLGPDGRGLLLLVSEPVGGAAAAAADPFLSEYRLALERFVEAPGGGLRPAVRYELPNAHSRYGFHGLVSSPDRRLSHALIYTRDDDMELLSFSGDGSADRLEPAARSRWPGQTTLVHDRRGRHVAAIRFDGGVRIHSLDAPPPVESGRSRERAYPTYKAHDGGCAFTGGPLRETVKELAGELEEQGEGSLRTRLARLESSATRSVDDKLLTVLALRESEHSRALRDVIEGFARRMARKHPSHAGVVLLLANIEAVAGNWGEVTRLLRRADPSDLDTWRTRHFHHVEGLAHLHGGRLGEAHEAFRRGAAHDGYCAMEPLMHLTRPMADPPAPGDWEPGQPTVRRLVGAVRTADRVLAAGDPAAALAALERPDVRWQQELQIAARRTAAYLETRSRTGAERFTERVALAFYVQLRNTDSYLRHNLFLPGLSWDEERLAELEERASDRLEELGET